uniref:T-box domain-containing protein n=1 Tax=Poecilia latipinna TaxID=48699 RepID=A0A3B3U3V7_9TELE
MASSKTRQGMVILKEGATAPAAAPMADHSSACLVAVRAGKVQSSGTVQGVCVSTGEANISGKHKMYPAKEAIMKMGELKHPACINSPSDVLSPDCVCKDVKVTLDNNVMWNEFYKCRTEMILTKQGSRMFPYCRFRVTGLQSSRKYSLVMDVEPLDNSQYRWTGESWQVCRKAERHVRSKPFVHPDSPATGQHWMQSPVSFYRLKLTNNTSDQEGNIILHPMHRYLPQLHVVQADKAIEDFRLNGPNVLTFTFPQTEFITVTTYQNPQFTQLKVNYNPFVKKLKEDRVNTCGLRLKGNAGKDSNSYEGKTNTEQHPVKKSLKILLANHKPRNSKALDVKLPPPKDSSRPVPKLISELICEAHVSLQRCHKEQLCSNNSNSSGAAQGNTTSTTLTDRLTKPDIAHKKNGSVATFTRKSSTVEKNRNIKDNEHLSNSNSIADVRTVCSSASPIEEEGSLNKSHQQCNVGAELDGVKQQKRPARLPLPALALFLKQHSTKSKKANNTPESAPQAPLPESCCSPSPAAAPHQETSIKPIMEDCGGNRLLPDEKLLNVTEQAAETNPSHPSGPDLFTASDVAVPDTKAKDPFITISECLSSESTTPDHKALISNSENTFDSLEMSALTLSSSSTSGSPDLSLHLSTALSLPDSPKAAAESSTLPSGSRSLKIDSLLPDPQCSSFDFDPLSPASSPEPLPPLPASLALELDSATSAAASTPDLQHCRNSSVFKWHTVLPLSGTYANPSFTTLQPQQQSTPVMSVTSPLLSCLPEPQSVISSTQTTPKDSIPSFQDSEQSLPFPAELSPLALQLPLSPTFSSLDEDGLSPTTSIAELVHFFSIDDDIGVEFSNTDTAAVTSQPLPVLEPPRPSVPVLPVSNNASCLVMFVASVGLKMTLLDPALSIDLQYLGVSLPIPLPGVSRTGKTTDLTQIKGWKEKFTSSEVESASAPKPEAGPSADLPKKNLSAFCSDMLDEYLESEGKLIDERASSFSQPPAEAPSYRLPVSSTSYVRTLDHILKKPSAGSPASDIISGFIPPSKRSRLKESAACRRAERKPRGPKPNRIKAACTASDFPTAVQLQYSVPGSLTSEPLNGPAFTKRRRLKPRASSQTLSVSTALNVSEEMAPLESDSELKPDSVRKQPSDHSVDGQRKESRVTVTRTYARLKELEDSVVLEGRFQTSISTERATIALMSLFTQTVSSILQRQAVACLNEFCRLGCVCSSLSHCSRISHCGRPLCMFGCSCLKQKMVLLKNLDSSDASPSPLQCKLKKKRRRMMKMAETVAHPAERVRTLWRKDADSSDPEPVHAPDVAPFLQPPLYFQIHVLSVMESFSRSSAADADKSPSASPPGSSEALCSKPSKRLMILADCKWVNDSDRSYVLKKLCEAMAQDQLDKPFWIKNYLITPIDETVDETSGNRCIEYKVVYIDECQKEGREDYMEKNGEGFRRYKARHELKRSTEGLNSHKKRRTGMSLPFPLLVGLSPSGFLSANKKKPGGPDDVNGKQYPLAKIKLGRMGALHPANRLAAYLTGRVGSTKQRQSSSSSEPSCNLQSIPHVTSSVYCVPPAPAASTFFPSSSSSSSSDRSASCAQLPPVAAVKRPALTNLSSSSSVVLPLPSPGASSSSSNPPIPPSVFLSPQNTCTFRIVPPHRVKDPIFIQLPFLPPTQIVGSERGIIQLQGPSQPVNYTPPDPLVCEKKDIPVERHNDSPQTLLTVQTADHRGASPPTRSPPPEPTLDCLGPKEEFAFDPMDLNVVFVDEVVDLVSSSETEDSSDFRESDSEDEKNQVITDQRNVFILKVYFFSH